ncbi:MAG: hypothetical protein J5998_06570 [Clostridia bacterium]|nr:hypothetical protein [Clostridia bacterium]
MKRGLALVLAAALLAGCSEAAQVEGQAFVVSLALDQGEEGGMTVSIQYPSYGGKVGDEDKSDYLISSASGADFASAMYALNAAVPRTVNLTQIKSLIVSETLASAGGFPGLLREIKLSGRINGEAYLVVTAGSARDFMAQQKPLIGLRLSDTIVTAMKRYGQLGGIPQTTVSETFYAANSFYEDPVAILAATAEEETPAPGKSAEDAEAGQLARSGENRDEYFGAALFRGGVMAGKLSGGETQLLNLVRGDGESMPMKLGGATLFVSRRGPLNAVIDLSGEAPRIDVAFVVAVEAASGVFDENLALSELTAGLNDLTALCQRLAVDPFGYGRRAAARFATIGDWLAYGWRSRFPRAAVVYSLTLRRTGV